MSNNDVVTCIATRTDGCANDATSNAIVMTVKQGPAIGTTTGFTTCTVGSTIGIYNSNTQGGGVWSSSNTSVATVTTSTSGGNGSVVTTGNGTAILTYSKTGSNGCISSASANVVVAVPTAPNAISGTNSICKGSTTQLSSTTTGGVWSILTSSYASISSTGLVNGNAAGTAIAKYTTTNAGGCKASVTYTVTINPLPLTPSIQYAIGTSNPQLGAGGAFCANRNFTVIGNPTGGVWSKTGVISVNGAGLVSTGSSAGTGTLTYTYTNANGCINSRTIAGNVVVCASRGVSGINNGQLIMDNGQFTMYPNPAKTFIRLNVETLIGAGSIVVTDLYGKTVKNQTLSMGNNTVDIASLSKGIYLVSVQTANGKKTQKLVVE